MHFMKRLDGLDHQAGTVAVDVSLSSVCTATLEFTQMGIEGPVCGGEIHFC